MTFLSTDDRYFLLRRLHSLTGIIPSGAFLLFHFFENASAITSHEAFNQTVIKIGEIPYLYFFEIFALLLPLAFHALFGAFLVFAARPNVLAYGYARNWAYFFQRVSGAFACIFIFYHVISTRGWALFVKGGDITHANMHAMLSSPWVLACYVIGIVSVTYHFSNGLWSFSITWGLFVSQNAQKRFAILTNVIFVLLCLGGLDILSDFVFGKAISSQLSMLVFW